MDPAALNRFVRERMAVAAAEGERAAAWVAESGGMSLYGSIGVEAVLRPDGTVWLHHDDHGRQEWAWREADSHERIAALVIAKERIPEIVSLLPERPPDAEDCARCEGSGRFLANVICPACDGLGWSRKAAT